MAFAVRREGSSLSITDQTSIEITPTTTNPQEKISSANPENQQPVDVEKQSKDAKDFTSSRKSDLQLQTLFQQMSLNVRLTERTEAEKKETTPLDTESGRSFKSETFPLEKGTSSTPEPKHTVTGQSRYLGPPLKEKVSKEPETDVGQSRNRGPSETEKVSREPEANVGQSRSTGALPGKKPSGGEFGTG